jgi:hypothetical protein
MEAGRWLHSSFFLGRLDPGRHCESIRGVVRFIRRKQPEHPPSDELGMRVVVVVGRASLPAQHGRNVQRVRDDPGRIREAGGPVKVRRDRHPYQLLLSAAEEAKILAARLALDEADLQASFPHCRQVLRHLVVREAGHHGNLVAFSQVAKQVVRGLSRTELLEAHPLHFIGLDLCLKVAKVLQRFQ